MSQNKLLIVVGIAVLAVAGLCALAAAGSMGVAALKLSQAATPSPTNTLVPTSTPTPAETPTPKPVKPRKLTQTAQAAAAVTQLPPAPTEAFPPPAQPAEPTLTVGPVLLDTWCVPWNTPREEARVEAVIDGVTIEVDIGGETYPVRYLGVDLLDYSQDPRFWTEATEANRALVEGKTVLLVRDFTDTDADGRLLRYVVVGGKFVNQALVEGGYVSALSMPPDVRCDAALQEAQAAALQAQRGLWAPTVTPTRTTLPPAATLATTGQVSIVKVSSKGTEWQEPEEYVEFLNVDILPIQLKGWTLQDNERHVFIFPAFVLGPGQYVRVYTNLYRPQNGGLSYYSPSPIWDDDADCAYLKNSLGILVDQFCYE